MVTCVEKVCRGDWHWSEGGEGGVGAGPGEDGVTAGTCEGVTGASAGECVAETDWNELIDMVLLGMKLLNILHSTGRI